MMTIDEAHTKAKEVATKIDNFFAFAITTRFAKSMNITVDGAISFGHDRISVPVNVFSFDTFRDFAARVIIDRNTYAVINVIK